MRNRLIKLRLTNVTIISGLSIILLRTEYWIPASAILLGCCLWIGSYMMVNVFTERKEEPEPEGIPTLQTTKNQEDYTTNSTKSTF